jgi:hypothetical protein
LVGTTGVLANLSSAKSSACRDQTPRKSKKSRPVGEVRLALNQLAYLVGLLSRGSERAARQSIERAKDAEARSWNKSH